MASAERWGFGGKINLAKMKEMYAKTPTIIRRCVRRFSILVSFGSSLLEYATRMPYTTRITHRQRWWEVGMIDPEAVC